jgi:hypothetical protein
MTTDETSKRIEDLVDRILRAQSQGRTGHGESTNGVQGLSQPEGRANSQGKIGELVPQPHGGALRRGNPGNRGGGRPSHAVKQAFCGDLELAHQRIRALLKDPSLRPIDLIDIFGKLMTRL